MVLFVTIDHTAQGLALAGIVRHVKNNSSGVWGKRNSRRQQQQQQRSSELPAMRNKVVGGGVGVATTQMMMGVNTITTTTTQQVASSSSSSSSSSLATAEQGSLLSSPYIPFDADLYRQEMIDIVYQRNMERMNL
jgi:hypothetical protein